MKLSIKVLALIIVIIGLLNIDDSVLSKLFFGNKEWKEMEFPEAGFAAVFPVPVMSESVDSNSLRYVAVDNDVQIQLIRTSVGDMLDVGSKKLLTVFIDGLRENFSDSDVTPPNTFKYEDKYPAVDYHMSGTASDGSKRLLKGRVILVGKYMYAPSVLYVPGDKNGLVFADRFLNSLRFM